MTAPKPETIERETPITLNEACAIFRGNLTPATLWAEQKRGRIVIFKIGRRYYTTRSDVELMVSKCRDEAKAPGSTWTKTVGHGPSETERAQSARAALRQSGIKLRSI